MSDAEGRGHGAQRAGLLAAAAWLVTLALAYLGVGGWLGLRIEGLDPAATSAWGPIACAAAFVAAVWATFRWTRARARSRDAAAVPEAGAEAGIGRRGFLAGSVWTLTGAAGVGAAVVVRNLGWLTKTGAALGSDVVETDPSPRPSWSGSRVQAYRRLGRTGFEVSDISLGSGVIREDNDGVAIARAAIERGINYFDTSPDYSGASSENALGEAIQGQRDKMFLATKFCTPDGHLPAGTAVADYMAAVEGSLRRLRTDYVDLVHVHSCDQIARLDDPNLHEAFDRLKEQGKARFLGMSTHTPNLEEVATRAIDSDRFDVLMLAYHHGAWPQLGSIIDRAAERDIGIVAMKTLKGAKHHGLAGFREDADAYSQAAFKWVLSNPKVSCLVVSFYEHQHVDEYLYASGKALTGRDRALLKRYDEQIAGKHCFAHCGACLDACPEQLAIHDVLRHRMYFEDYGNEKRAMEAYAGLAKQADVCIGCAAPCTGACPFGVPIQERAIGAHRLLTLS